MSLLHHFEPPRLSNGDLLFTAVIPHLVRQPESEPSTVEILRHGFHFENPTATKRIYDTITEMEVAYNLMKKDVLPENILFFFGSRQDALNEMMTMTPTVQAFRDKEEELRRKHGGMMNTPGQERKANHD